MIKMSILNGNGHLPLRKTGSSIFCASRDVVNGFFFVTVLWEASLLGRIAKLRSVTKTIIFE